MTAYKILKQFDYSHDGIHAKTAKVDSVVGDIPAASIDGLKAEGYIEVFKGKSEEPHGKAIEAAPENKAISSAPENKAAKPKRQAPPRKKG